MADKIDEFAQWSGRELVDANGQRIGVVLGPAFARRRFGMTWLVVETSSGGRPLVPADPIRLSRDRLVLPYPKDYIEGAPAAPDDGILSRTEQRRLFLHYGLDSALPGSQCRACGLCMATMRAQKTAARAERARLAEQAAGAVPREPAEAAGEESPTARA